MRRHELDWIRVLVFALLILYHVGMFFVPWGWHLKNNVIYEDIRWPMIFVNRWRLPILFVISGIGTFYALRRRTGGQFVAERFWRLIVPLIVGILLIVPPQVYVERLIEGATTANYWSWYATDALRDGSYPAGNFSWHHLWFLPYLFLFSVVLLPLFLWLRPRTGGAIHRTLQRWTRRPWLLYFPVPLLFLTEALLEPFFPSTHALVGDWFNLINFGGCFLIGFLLVYGGDHFWETAERARWRYVGVGTLTFTLLVLRWFFLEDSVVVHFSEAFVHALNLWSWILAIFGFGKRHLSKPSRALSYANRAVYPFYILHQTITVILAYHVKDLPWSGWSKAGLLIVGTFGGCWLIYELLIRRVRWLQPLFGVKAAPRAPESGETSP